jgi:carbon monoxide dehydrogenase subunit G
MTHSGSFLTQRSPDEVFDLLASPERFAPLLPDFDSMSMHENGHFTLRIVISAGQINGHASLAMQLRQAVRPTVVEYSGQAVVAGGPLTLELRYQISPVDGTTEVKWQGEFALDGMMALMAGSLIETMGRKNFERMAQRLCDSLRPDDPEDTTSCPASEA